MASGGLMAISVVMGFLLLVGMHWYYPQNALSSVAEKAAARTTISEGFVLGPTISFSVGILIEYAIVVFAIYLFLRSIVRSFGR